MNDDRFKNFLQENASPVPAAPLGEASRIWRHIGAPPPKRKWWLVFAPVSAVALVFVIFTHMQVQQAEIKKEEDYLISEWSEIMTEVDSDVEPELVKVFGK